MSCLNEASCSSSSTISPRCGVAQDGAARPDHDLDPPGGDLLPVPVALRRAQVAVQHGDVRKAGAKPRNGLRGQADFRYQHDGLPAKMDHFLDRLHVQLGFPAAGHTVHEQCLEPPAVDRRKDGLHRLLLVRIELQPILAGELRFRRHP